MVEKFFTLDFTKKIDKKIDKERLINQALPKAKKILEEYSIKEEELRDGMYEGAVDIDLREVATKEANFSGEIDDNIAEAMKLSEIFNALLIEQFEKNDWMGENAFTVGTAKYDKYKTGMSNITEFRKETGISYMAMGIRTTLSHNPSNIENKLWEIKENIKKGELTNIKYFVSDYQRGELKNVPSVIIGCDKEMLFESIELWLGNKNKELAKHPLQFLILDQVAEQIEYFKKEASSRGRYDLVDIYDKVFKNINEVLKNKEVLRNELNNPKEGDSLRFKENNDSVNLALKQALKNTFK